MVTLLEHPAVQGGVAPLVAALIVAAIFARTRFAWLAILAAYATMVALTTGFSLTPLTVARKTILLGLIVPFVGLALDLHAARLEVAGAASCRRRRRCVGVDIHFDPAAA